MPDPYDLQALNAMVGTRCRCERCGRPCRVGVPVHPNARLLKRSQVPHGYCATCAATQFLKGTAMVGLIDANPQMLLAPHVQEQFARLMQAGNADANPAEIDWEALVLHWPLPVKGGQGGLF